MAWVRLKQEELTSKHHAVLSHFDRLALDGLLLTINERGWDGPGSSPLTPINLQEALFLRRSVLIFEGWEGEHKTFRSKEETEAAPPEIYLLRFRLEGRTLVWEIEKPPPPVQDGPA